MDTAYVCRARSSKSDRAGFTLIEIMITLVIVSVLATLAHASYQSSVQRTRRADMQRTMLSLQLQQQQYYRQHARYAQSLTQLDYQASAYYQLTLSVNPPGVQPHRFLLSATAHQGGSQATDSPCSTLSLDSNGRRTPVAGCW